MDKDIFLEKAIRLYFEGYSAKEAIKLASLEEEDKKCQKIIGMKSKKNS